MLVGGFLHVQRGQAKVGQGVVIFMATGPNLRSGSGCRQKQRCWTARAPFIGYQLLDLFVKRLSRSMKNIGSLIADPSANPAERSDLLYVRRTFPYAWMGLD